MKRLFLKCRNYLRTKRGLLLQLLFITFSLFIFAPSLDFIDSHLETSKFKIAFTTIVIVIIFITQVLLIKILFNVVRLSLSLIGVLLPLMIVMTSTSLIFTYLFNKRYEEALYAGILPIIFIILALVCQKFSGYRFPNMMTIPDKLSKDKKDGI